MAHQVSENSNPIYPSYQFADQAAYQLLVESMQTDAVILLDPDGYIRSWNSGARNISGYQASEILGQHFSCFFTETDRVQGLPQRNLEATKTQERLEQAGWRVRRDGGQFWASVTITALRDADGQLLGFSHVTQDITDRKQTEEALQQSNTLLRSIMESLPDVIFAKDLQGRYVTINSSGANFLDKSIEDVVGQDDAALFPPDIARHIMQQDQEIMQAGITENVEDALPHNGQWRTYLSTKTPWRDVQGNTIGIIGISRDISDRKQIEESLRQEKDFTHLVVESVSEGVVACDAEGNLKLFNGTARDWHGCDLKAISPEEWADFYNLYEADGVTPLEIEKIPLMRAFQGESIRDVGMAIVAKGQMPRYILASGDPLFDQDGQKTGAVVVMHDITARKQAEAEQARLVAILEATPDFVGIADATGRSIYVNQSGRRMVGLAEDVDITSMGVQDFTPASSLDTVLNGHLPSAVRDGLWSGEGALQHLDGTEIPVLQVIMAHQSDGKVEFFSTIARDISDRKQIEATLQESETRFRHAAAAAQAQAQQLEQTLHELQQTQAQLIQHEKMSSLGQLVAGVAHEINNPVNFIYGNLTHAGEYTRDLMNLLKLYQDHYPNPVPEIEAETEAVDLEFLMEDLPKLLSSMRVGAERIQKIVLSLRNFSRMDEADMKTVDVHEGIDSTLMILQNRLKAKPDHPEIKILKDYGPLPPVECYAGQLNQVLMNILTNAVDALEESSAQQLAKQLQPQATSIQIQTQTVTPDRVRISIRDNGPGIPEAVQQRLFTPFFTTKPVGKGTGLGLSISYQIITEKHGGTLQCLSKLDQGTEFVIEIPVHQSRKETSLKQGSAIA